MAELAVPQSNALSSGISSICPACTDPSTNPAFLSPHFDIKIGITPSTTLTTEESLSDARILTKLESCVCSVVYKVTQIRELAPQSTFTRFPPTCGSTALRGCLERSRCMEWTCEMLINAYHYGFEPHSTDANDPGSP